MCYSDWLYVGYDPRKPVFGICDQDRFKPVYPATEKSYNDENIVCGKSSYSTFPIANNKSTEQTARMRRLVCAFVFHIQQSQVY